MKTTTCDVTHPHYTEPEALQQLLTDLNEAVGDANELMVEEDIWYGGMITINVGGGSTAFTLGGPQIEGLYQFIRTIAKENGYEVDVNNSTVTA